MTWTTLEMNNFLMGALAFSMAFNLRLLRPSRMAPYTQLIEQLSEAIGAQKNALARIREAVESTAGGIGKRVWENIEITESINSLSPELFKQCPSLIYDLHATDQFLNSLCDAMANGLHPTQKELVERQKTERAALFIYLYDKFDLAQPQARHDAPTENSGAI